MHAVCLRGFAASYAARSQEMVSFVVTAVGPTISVVHVTLTSKASRDHQPSSPRDPHSRCTPGRFPYVRSTEPTFVALAGNAVTVRGMDFSESCEVALPLPLVLLGLTDNADVTRNRLLNDALFLPDMLQLLSSAAVWLWVCCSAA